MTIGIDIDDTLADTASLLKIYWQEYYLNNPKKDYNKLVPSNINTGWDDPYINLFWDTYRFKMIHPPIKEDASNILNKLKKDNHTLCIVTSRSPLKYPNIEADLKIWMKENNIPIDIFYTDVRNKGIFCKENNIDILIDDTYNHIKEANNLNIKTILFNKEENYKGPQTTSWKEVYSIIKEL